MSKLPQCDLNELFGDIGDRLANDWGNNSFHFSGWGLLDKINNGDSVLDVGCGCNPFKGKIKNLIGIDPANVNGKNSNADIKVSIEEFETNEKFDVAFCLGSIQFGDEARVINQIEKIVSLLNDDASIYWRYCGDSSRNPKLFYNWTFEKLAKLAEVHGFKQTVEEYDYKENKRILGENEPVDWHRKEYAEWHRGSRLK